MKERSGNGAYLSMGALRGVPGKRVVKDIQRKTMETVISLHSDLVGEPGGRFVY
jgi:hypothetical protein